MAWRECSLRQQQSAIIARMRRSDRVKTADRWRVAPPQRAMHPSDRPTPVEGEVMPRESEPPDLPAERPPTQTWVVWSWGEGTERRTAREFMFPADWSVTYWRNNDMRIFEVEDADGDLRLVCQDVWRAMRTDDGLTMKLWVEK